MPLHDILSPTGACPDSNTLKQAALGALEETQQHALESHLLDCEVCSEAIEGLKNTPHATDHLPVLQARFEAFRKAPVLQKKSRFTGSFFLRVAAIALPLVLAVAWWFWPKESSPPLAVREVVPYEKFSGGLDLIPTFRGGGGFTPDGDDPKALLRQAILAYENNSLDTARELFLQWQIQDTLSVISPLFLGLCDLEQGQNSHAVAHLEQVHRSNQLPEISSWYLSQAYWKNGQDEQAKPLLEYLIRRNSVYAPKAATLLSELSAETMDR